MYALYFIHYYILICEKTVKICLTENSALNVCRKVIALTPFIFGFVGTKSLFKIFAMNIFFDMIFLFFPEYKISK